MAFNPAMLPLKLGLLALSYGLSALNKIEGPRLESLDVTTADYGTPIIRFWGKRRLEGCPIIWAEKLREKKVTSKTKGGKYSEYKYFGTFAVIVADHAIDAISRIWMDKHLVYDATNDGPISVLGGFFQGQSRPVKLVRGKNMRIYDGSQTEPDPRMEAWCEDRYGADSCPAYKDISYIVWEDIPLEKFGNRIPQITVEAISTSSNDFIYAEEDVDGSATLHFSPDYTHLLADGWVWDTATRSRMWAIPFSGGDNTVGVDGTTYHLSDFLGTGGGPYLTIYEPGGMIATTVTLPNAADEVFVSADQYGNDFVWCRPYAAVAHKIYVIDQGLLYTTNLAFSPHRSETDSDGNVWIAGTPNATAEIHLYCASGPRFGETHSFSTGSLDFVKIWINSKDEFILEQNGNLHRLASDFTSLQTATITATGTMTHASGSDSMWRVATTAVVEYDLTDLSEVRTLNQSSWSGATGNMSGGKYDAVSHAIVSTPTDHMVWRFIDRPASAGVNFSDIVGDVSDWCRVTAYSFSGTDPVVQGYSVTQGPGKDMLGPLMDIYGVDARPHDFGVQFLVRGSSAAGTIAVADFVREGDEPRYVLTRTVDTDLPRQISVNFADKDKDQQANTVIAQRPLDATDGERTRQIDLSTFVGDPPAMQKYADRYFRRLWNGRDKVSNALTAQYLALEPGDVWNLQLDGVTQSHRLVKTTLSQGRINCEWERDFPSLQVLGSGTGAAMDGRDNDQLLIPGPSKGFVVDIPLTSDAEASDLPLLHYAAGSYGGTFWPGAVIYEGDGDDNDFYPWQGVDVSEKAVWGFATDALADANPNLFDQANSVNIKAYGTLTSCTEAEIDADPTLNMALLGNELLNFTTATLEADGTYTLSGFKRGRRGTEWACDDHAIGDQFVMVASLQVDSLGLSDVGLDKLYKTQTVGRDLASVPTLTLAFAGNTLRPYAPASLDWVFDGTDLDGTITRRTRVGGAWTGGSTIPLSEASEAYEVDIYVGATFKRTITVTGTNVFSYTAAMAATDGVTLPTPPTAYVYQMSDAVGRGFALAA